MKKLLAAVLLTSSIAGPALAADSPWYVGASVGPSDIGSWSSTAVGAFIGYTLPGVTLGGLGSLAVEGQFTSLGSTPYSNNFSSVGVDAVADIPIKGVQNLSVFGNLGLNDISGDFRCGNFCSYSSSSGLTPDFGFGAQYRFTREFGLRVGYHYYDNDFSSVYAAAVFHF